MKKAGVSLDFFFSNINCEEFHGTHISHKEGGDGEKKNTKVYLYWCLAAIFNQVQNYLKTQIVFLRGLKTSN